METKLTVIVDNTACGTLRGEWGLSLLAEHRGKRILVDAGASDLYAANMRKLGLSPAGVDCAVLSHAHYDHANGLPRFLRENPACTLYLQRGAAADCYARWLFFHRYIGVPRRLLPDFADRIRFVSGVYPLWEGAWLVSHSTPGLAAVGRREKMYRRTPSGWTPDDFSHEQSLVLDTDKGLVIINSCSHGGAVNIIHEVRAAFPGKTVYGIVGGFHLYNKSPDEVRQVAQSLLDTGVSFVCTGHCTGQRAYDLLKEALGDRLCRLRCGLVMTF